MIIQKFVNSKSFSCNLYILSSEKGNLLIDPGYYDESIRNYIQKIGGISSILITHGHFDHIMGLNAIYQDFQDVKVYIFDLEETVLLKPSMNCSSYIGQPYIPTCPLELLQEGKFKIDGYEIEVIHTPGHTKGSCMFYFKDENVLFTGDTIIGQGIGRTDLPTGSESKLFASLYKIKNFNFNDSLRCYFGHEKPLNYGQLKEINYHLK
ncbi:MAG: MBL fold metallo-hydrolase [Bacilli bacterium]